MLNWVCGFISGASMVWAIALWVLDPAKVLQHPPSPTQPSAQVYEFMPMDKVPFGHDYMCATNTTATGRTIFGCFVPQK